MIDQPNKLKKIAVIGAGSWGTAFANHAATLDSEVWIFTRFAEQADEINQHHTNQQSLLGITLNSKIRASQNLLEVIEDAELIFLVIPAQNIRAFLKQYHQSFNANQFILIGTKGIENKSLKLMDQVVAEYLECNIGILSGPNFASEIARGLPATSYIACKNLEDAKYYSNLLTTPNFKCEFGNDVIGAQILGSLKNILAIGCGICQGLSLGDNFTASVFNQGIQEIKILLNKLGGDSNTIFSAAGIGDLFLTCSSSQSRNYSLGVSIGSGNQNIDEILNRPLLTEGFKSAKSVNDIIINHNLSLPLLIKVYNILFNHNEIESIRMIFNE